MQSTSYSPEKWWEFLLLNDEKLLSLVRVDVFKGSGKGGQKRNKTSNAVRLTLSHLMVTDQSSREKSINQKRALNKLRLTIALDLPDPASPRVKFKELPEELHPTIQAGLIRLNPKNPLYPVFTACFLDAFLEAQGDWKQTAEFFHTSSSQIRKFVHDQPALAQVIQRLQAK